jgi:hypothetical protein
MSDFNVSGLTPEEKQQLISLLQESDSPVEQGAEMGNPDAEQDESLIRAICTEMMDPLQQQIELLSQIVNDEIIGGVTQLYNQKQKMAEIERLKQEYGTDEYFPGDTQDFYKEATDGQDLFDKLYEDISGAKGEGSDWGPEQETPYVGGLASKLKEKMGKLRGTTEAPPVAVEVSKVETNPKMDAVVSKIRALKQSGKMPKGY